MNGAARLAGHRQGDGRCAAGCAVPACSCWSPVPFSRGTEIEAKGRSWLQTLWFFVLWTGNLQQPLGELLHHLPPVSHGAGQGTHCVYLSRSCPSLPSPTEPPQGSSGAADSNFASSRMRI